MPAAIFHPGRVLMTPGAMEALARAKTVPSALLSRHVAGDWGTLDKGDTRANDSALKTGLRILSSYPLGGRDETVWIITDAIDKEAGGDPKRRDLTTLLLPEEY